MKKNLLIIWGCMALGTAFAQIQLPRVEVFTPQGEVKESIPGSNVQGVSLNGEWAVGFGTEYSQHSFIWNRTTGEYSLITGSYEDLSYAYGVSNDGTVVGAFYEDTEGNGGLGYMLPGIWKDGVWTKLQMERETTGVYISGHPLDEYADALEQLDEEMLTQILTQPKNALCKQYQKLLGLAGIELTFEEDAVRAIARQAIERRCGARGLRAVLEDVMTKIMYEIPSDPSITKVLITQACVEKGEEPEVVRSKERRRPNAG